MKLCMKRKLFILKICEKNTSVNLRFEIFVVAFRARKLFGTFKKRAPGDLLTYLELYCKCSDFLAPFCPGAEHSKVKKPVYVREMRIHLHAAASYISLLMFPFSCE